MTDEKKEKKNTDYNIFITNLTYPEAEQVFTAKFKSLEEIKNDCIVVGDTNALLVPYKINKESLEQIKKTYLGLEKDGRLVIPAQVAREFARNRAGKIVELYDQLSKKRDSINNVQIGNYPLLESIPEYNQLLELEKQINNSVKDFRKTIG